MSGLNEQLIIDRGTSTTVVGSNSTPSNPDYEQIITCGVNIMVHNLRLNSTKKLIPEQEKTSPDQKRSRRFRCKF